MNSRRRCVWLTLAVVAALCLVRPATWFCDRLVYAQLRQDAADLVGGLSDRRPADVPPVEWDVASGWSLTAYHNVCFSPSHVSLPELTQFKVDLERELAADDVDLETIDWLWRRLHETGPHGKQYVERFEPLFREDLAAAREQAGAESGIVADRLDP